MTNLQQNNRTGNRARRDRRVYRQQPQWRTPRRNPRVEASIVVSRYGSTFGIATVIYRDGHPPNRSFTLLNADECRSEERAWLIGYQRVTAWFDENESGTSLFIISADERRERRAA